MWHDLISTDGYKDTPFARWAERSYGHGLESYVNKCLSPLRKIHMEICNVLKIEQSEIFEHVVIYEPLYYTMTELGQTMKTVSKLVNTINELKKEFKGMNIEMDSKAIFVLNTNIIQKITEALYELKQKTLKEVLSKKQTRALIILTKGRNEKIAQYTFFYKNDRGIYEIKPLPAWATIYLNTRDAAYEATVRKREISLDVDDETFLERFGLFGACALTSVDTKEFYETELNEVKPKRLEIRKETVNLKSIHELPVLCSYNADLQKFVSEYLGDDTREFKFAENVYLRYVREIEEGGEEDVYENEVPMLKQLSNEMRNQKNKAFLCTSRFAS